MADKAINDLPSAVSVEEEDLFVLEQNGTAKKLSGNTLVVYLLSLIDGHGGITSITWEDSGTSGNGATHTGTITMADGTFSTLTVRDGVKGSTGAASYVWIKYAGRNPTADSDIGDAPDAWIGVYSGTQSTAPTSYASYRWYRIKGDTGPGAVLLTRTVQYQESTSPINATGTWQDTVPAVAPGNYLWTHVTITFDSGEPVSWFEVARQGTNGIDGTGAVSSVNGVSPDTNHDVTLTASDIYDGTTSVADKLATLENSITTSQSQITASGLLKGSGAGVVSAAVLGTDYGAASFTITLTANGWTNNAQTISDSRFRATGFAYWVSPSGGDRTAYSDSDIYADNVSTNGQMTFNCANAPSVSITVNIVRVVSA